MVRGALTQMEKVTDEVGTSADDVVLSVQTAAGFQPVGAENFASLPSKLRVKLEAAKPAGEVAREFLLLIAPAEGINANPRRCKVEASTVAGLRNALL